MIRRPPRSTRLTHSFPTRRSSDLHGVRRYGSEDVRRLRFIRQAQASGFTLEQIRELLELDAGADRARARTLAETRIAALDEKIAELERARDEIGGASCRERVWQYV